MIRIFLPYPFFFLYFIQAVNARHLFHKLNVPTDYIQTLHMLCQYHACCFRSVIQRNMQRKFAICVRYWTHHYKLSPHEKLLTGIRS